MSERYHRGFSAAEKTELWDRWQRGESLKAIGRAFGKPSSSIYFQYVGVCVSLSSSRAPRSANSSKIGINDIRGGGRRTCNDVSAKRTDTKPCRNTFHSSSVSGASTLGSEA